MLDILHLPAEDFFAAAFAIVGSSHKTCEHPCDGN